MASLSASPIVMGMLLSLVAMMLAASAVRAQSQTCGLNRIITMDFDVMNNDLETRLTGSLCACTDFCKSRGCSIFTYMSSLGMCYIKRVDQEANFVTIFMSDTSIEIPGHLRSDWAVGKNEANSKGACISRCQNTRTCDFINVQTLRSGRVNCDMYGGTTTGGFINIMAGTVPQPPIPPPQPSPSPSSLPSNPPPAISPAPSPSANSSPPDNSPTAASTTSAVDAGVTVTDSTGSIFTTTRLDTIAPSR
ncbi:hypothetical protein BC829DRAFT_79312 [Chytridium lagenaria]|nr:hypothetical protein BC829DRAFT_79312 [Chytridium lagenaria]